MVTESPQNSERIKMNIELPYGNHSRTFESQVQTCSVAPDKAEYLVIGYLAGELSARLGRFHDLIRGVVDRRFDCFNAYYENQADFQEMASIYVFKHVLEREMEKHPETRGFELPGTSRGIWAALVNYSQFTNRVGKVYSHNVRFKKRADRRVADKTVPHLKDLIDESLKST